MLSQTDRDWIRDHVALTAQETAKAIITEVMAQHIAACPHGQKLGKYIFVLTGLAACVGTIVPSTLNLAILWLRGSH
jgi:hypothetical protein